MGLSARIIVDERAADRYTVDLQAFAAHDLERIEFSIQDLSEEGFRALCKSELNVGSTVDVETAKFDARQATVVWRYGQIYGFQFVEPMSKATLAACRNVHGLNVITFPTNYFPEPHIRKFSYSTRVGILLGAALLPWALILPGAYFVIR